MSSKMFLVIAAILLLSVNNNELLAAQPAFEGKAIRIVVGFSAGGGFDTYSRAIARHMGKHIPGNPSIIVENMTGAGSMSQRTMSTESRNLTGLPLAIFTVFRS